MDTIYTCALTAIMNSKLAEDDKNIVALTMTQMITSVTGK
jgi:hypothetical protein